MEKLILAALIASSLLFSNDLDKLCLSCHQKNRLPTELIYKRYLLKYSTKNRIKSAIFNYLKNPTPKNSIMPKPFFDKFNQKPQIELDDKELKRVIDLFIKRYDIKQYLK